jgi:hypothetical protein
MSEDLHILTLFEPITLEEMDNVKLMNRTDTKFNFNRCHFETLMEELTNDYRILDVEGHRVSRYESLYYDTDNFLLYTVHQNGKLNRYKVRHRTYVDSNMGFLEVKFKNNKGRTIKDRIKEAEVPLNWNENEEHFLRKKVPFDPDILKPVLWVNYKRLTLVNKNSPERLTLDLDLEFIFKDKTEELSNLVIAEVKQDKRATSPFIHVMKKHHLREGGFSKYCLGMALTNNTVKKNNFKKKLIRLKHILHDRDLTSTK